MGVQTFPLHPANSDFSRATPLNGKKTYQTNGEVLLAVYNLYFFLNCQS